MSGRGSAALENVTDRLDSKRRISLGSAPGRVALGRRGANRVAAPGRASGAGHRKRSVVPGVERYQARLNNSEHPEEFIALVGAEILDNLAHQSFARRLHPKRQGTVWIGDVNTFRSTIILVLDTAHPALGLKPPEGCSQRDRAQI